VTGPETFISHLIELRDRLLRIVVGFILIFVCMFPFANKIYSLLAHPLLAKLPAGAHMIATAVTAPFFIPMKVAMLAAFMVSLPHTLYQIWSFVAPGLYQHEKRFIGPIVIASTLLFMLGMVFAYFVVFPVVFGFLAGSTPEGVSMMTDIGSYLDFVITLFMAFGIAFEVPIAVVLSVKFGFVTVAVLRDIRPYVIVGAFIIGAIFTPPDVISQLMLAVPLCVLYEIGILVSAAITRKAVLTPQEFE